MVGREPQRIRKNESEKVLRTFSEEGLVTSLRSSDLKTPTGPPTEATGIDSEARWTY